MEYRQIWITSAGTVPTDSIIMDFKNFHTF